MLTRRLTWITAATSALSLALAALAAPAWVVQTPGGQRDSDYPARPAATCFGAL